VEAGLGRDLAGADALVRHLHMYVYVRVCTCSYMYVYVRVRVCTRTLVRHLPHDATKDALNDALPGRQEPGPCTPDASSALRPCVTGLQHLYLRTRTATLRAPAYPHGYLRMRHLRVRHTRRRGAACAAYGGASKGGRRRDASKGPSRGH
jgi:hypothetical protein